MAFPTFHYPLLAAVFGVLGNIVSVMVYLAPVPTFYRIWRKKSTEGFKSLPYLVALFSSLLWLYYALLKGNVKLLITINSFGCIVETVYIIMFLTYAAADNKKSTLRLLVGMAGAFSLAILITHYSVTIKELRVTVFGWICVTVSVAVFVAPLSIAARVLKTKSVEFMPFSLSFFLTLSAIMWFFYGFFRNDICIMIPNTIGFALGMSQMSLYALYRNANKLIIDEKLPEQVQEIVMVSTLGAREVHPKSVVDIILPVVADESGGGNPSKHDGTVQKNCNTPPV